MMKRVASGEHQRGAVATNTNNNKSRGSANSGKSAGHTTAQRDPWTAQRLVMAVVASAVTVLVLYVVVSSTAATSRDPSGAMPTMPPREEGVRAASSRLGKADGKESSAGSKGAQSAAPLDDPPRRGFNHNGEGGTNSPKPPLKPAPEARYSRFITTKDAFIRTVADMTSGSVAAATAAGSSSTTAEATDLIGNAPPAAALTPRRVDSCAAPFLSSFDIGGSGSDSVYGRTALKQYLHDEVEALLQCGTRVGGSGSEGYKCAMAFLRARMRCLVEGPTTRRWWRATIDSYDKVKTVIGDRYFSNFIAEFEAGDEARYGHLVLAAHWDSKDMPADPKTNKTFVAATDSAVPVVLILEVMKYVSAYAEMLKRAHGGTDEGLDIPLPRITVMLFDGEEAFIEWRDEDNTYGSRLQAARWKREQRLKGITTFMLLDLIGSADSQLHNLFHGQSGKQYAALRNIEMAFYDESVRVSKAAMALNKGSGGDAILHADHPEWRHWPIDALGLDSVPYNGQSLSNKKKTRDSYFPREPLGISASVSDDHLPWLQERVPILHLISLPFPKVWHTLADDNEHVHYDTVYEYLRVFTEYVLTYTKAGADPQRV